MQTSRNSTLKQYRVEELDEGDALVTCPHCKNGFIVNLKLWKLLKKAYIGRSCPYCFKTGRIPVEEEEDPVSS